MVEMVVEVLFGSGSVGADYDGGYTDNGGDGFS